jgi:hypothetical protein
MDSASPAVPSDRGASKLDGWRLWIFGALATAEILLLSYLYDSPRIGLPFWQEPMFYATTLAKTAVVTLPLLAIAAWPRRQAIVHAYRECADGGLRYFLAANMLHRAICLPDRGARGSRRDQFLFMAQRIDKAGFEGTLRYAWSAQGHRADLQRLDSLGDQVGD